jgi:hypothetical protein
VLEDLPPDGAFIWIQEYRPAQGDVWADIPRSRFPPKPERFNLRRSDLEPGLYCHTDGPAYGTTFRAADRPFQLFIAFGKGVTSERLAQTEAILASLEFATLPSPPLDPYAGWPLVNDTSGDSLRPPPGWPGAAVDYRPGKTPRPRLLFFTSNLPLWGLPKKLVAHMDEPSPLDQPFPIGALATDFPPDGVIIWVVEEGRKGEWSLENSFAPITRGWPSRDDFEPTEIATEPAPELRWMSAGGSFRGHRFSVWIGQGPRANRKDFELALKSAASLAVSGCWRDAYDDCPDENE